MNCSRYLPFLMTTLGCVLWALPVSADHKEESFKLGVLLCLSGDCAEWGNNSLKGVKLAAKEINAAGGILGKKVELEIRDTREGGVGSNSVTAYRSIASDTSVKYMIGTTWSVGSLPIAPMIGRRKDVLITSPSTGLADFNESSANIFNTWPHDSVSSIALADYAIEKGWTRAAVFSGNDPWVLAQAQTFKKRFEGKGGEILIHVETQPQEKDVRTEALKIWQKKPDLVFYADTYNFSIAARELKELKYEGAQMTILMDKTRLEDGAGALEGTVFAQYDPATDDFVTTYKQEYGEEPGISADTAYDAVQLYARAIKDAGELDPVIVKDVLLKLEHEGASGKIVFDSKGGVIRQPSLWYIKNGKYAKVIS